MPISSHTRTERNSSSDDDEKRQYSLAARAGVILMIGMVIIISGMVAYDPSSRSVSAGYMKVALKFWNGEPLYDPTVFSGFLYLPSFAVAYLPFTAFGLPIGDLLWRAVTLGLLFYALMRVVRRLEPRHKIFEILGLAFLISLVGSAAAVRIGQSTTLLLATTMLAFDAAFDRAFVKAAAWATLAVIAKPLGVVVWLLIGGTSLAAVPWLIGFLGIAILAPYAVADTAYVNALYGDFADLLLVTMPAKTGKVDFSTFFRILDISISVEAYYAIRVIAALLTLGAVYWLTRRRNYMESAVFTATLACSYMLLFNPTAETNTYILMAVPFSLLAAYMLRETKQVIQGIAVTVACVALGAGPLGIEMNRIDPFLLIFVVVVWRIFTAGRACDESAPR